jgi:hypothetical protein
MRSGNGAGLGKGAFWRSTSLLFIPYFGIFVALTEATLLSEVMLLPVMGVLKLTCIVNFF